MKHVHLTRDKTLAQVIKRLVREYGAVVTVTGSSHLKVCVPGMCRPLFVGRTPSEWRTVANFEAEVRRELRKGQGDV